MGKLARLLKKNTNLMFLVFSLVLVLSGCSTDPDIRDGYTDDSSANMLDRDTIEEVLTDSVDDIIENVSQELTTIPAVGSEETVTIEETEEVSLETEELVESKTETYIETIPQDSSFSVHFIDVGQADAALVECDGHYMLIDGGNKEDSSLIYTVLKKMK